MYRNDLFKNILVIGGNVAGLAAASQAKRANPELNVTVLESGKYISYGSCGLPYYISGIIKDFDDLFVYPVEFFKKERDIEVLTGHKVVELDSSNRQVVVQKDSQQNTEKIGYDRLIICSGASPYVLNIPGIHSKNIFNFWNVEDTLNVKKFINNHSPKKAVVVGGGSIGLLMAEAFKELGIDVTVLEIADMILKEYEDEVSNIMLKTLNLKQVKVMLSTAVKSFAHDNNIVKLVSVKKEGQIQDIETDFVLISTGVKANTGFIKNSSIVLGKNGAIKVNSQLQTSHLNIYAAGDCATVKNIITGKDDYVPTANNAAKMGRIAGSNAAGTNDVFPGSVKTKVDKVFGLEIAKTGLNLKEAKNYGYNAVKITGNYPSHVRNLPGAENITVVAIVDFPSRKLLGAQMLGKQGIAKRIDIFATAITSELTIDQVYMLDLSYAPKISTVWDPVNKICGKAILKLKDMRF
ncbi:MAG: FAD-dependent oxidoreductase [Candidatus Humimicrobiaceae bacterium]